MSDRVVFVSCGQRTPEELAMGTHIQSVIDQEDGFLSYFADQVQSLDGLSEHVLQALHTCSAAVVVMHGRGTVIGDEGEDLGVRSSVWVNQELAILAFRKVYEVTTIPILAFAESDVNLEGAMTALILNPNELTDQESVGNQVRDWLRTSATAAPSPPSDAVFTEKWERLGAETRRVLICLIDEGGLAVKEASLRRCYRKRFGTPNNQASRLVREARGEFINTDLVQYNRSIVSGDEFTLNPTWEWQLKRAVAAWQAENA